MAKKTSEQQADKHSADMQSKVEAAWHADQPKELTSVAFGADAVGHGYRVWVGPVVRDLAKATGCKTDPTGMSDLRNMVADWEPDGKDWERVKGLLLAGVDEMSHAIIGLGGAADLDDDFFVKAPDLMQQRAKAQQTLAGAR